MGSFPKMNREPEKDVFAERRKQETQWVDVQKKTFTRWCNEFLKRRGIQIEDLYKDLSDGLVLINLLEILTHPKTVGKHNAKPRIGVAKIENLAIVLNFIKREGIVLVNIGAEDIHEGNANCILGLIWTLILKYQISLGDDDANHKNELLEWVRSKIGPNTPYKYPVDNFTKDWNDGKRLAALVDALSGGRFPNHAELPTEARQDRNRNCQEGIDKSFDMWEIPKLLDGEDMANPKLDQNSMMTYISYFRNLDPDKLYKGPPPKQPGDDAKNTRAYGPGLQPEGLVQCQPAEFKVEAPEDTEDELEIRVIGPDGEFLPAEDVKITPKTRGNWECEYNPQEPGEYKVLVMLGGFHVPGSTFTVHVAKDDSLGGEGKVVVFFSSTSSTQKGRDDFFKLQDLFKKKEIHLREDFQPWVPIDVLPREDREAVFRMAGVRNLPIVFINDQYTGDYDTCQSLEDKGELDKRLNYKGARSGKRKP